MPTAIPGRAAAGWHRLAVALVAALALLELLWESALAPVRPGGSWLALKALPLAFLWWRMRRGSRRARQVASLVLPLYAAEGIVRALSEAGRHGLVAAVATMVALAVCAALLASFRAERSAR